MEVDGSDPASKDERDRLFSVSSLRGKYPQVFLAGAYIGDHDKLEQLAECDSLPPDVLEANPLIETFTRVFVGCSK